jgi:hypothetical protein
MWDFSLKRQQIRVNIQEAWIKLHQNNASKSYQSDHIFIDLGACINYFFHHTSSYDRKNGTKIKFISSFSVKLR